MSEYHGCKDGILCTHGLPNELGNSRAEEAADGAILDAIQVPARASEANEIAELRRELAEMERIALHWQTKAHELIALLKELLDDGSLSANIKASAESGAVNPRVTTVIYADWIERSEAAIGPADSAVGATRE